VLGHTRTGHLLSETTTHLCIDQHGLHLLQEVFGLS
jgi:hypothetical protein